MSRSKRHTWALLGVVALVLTAGCLSMSAEIEVANDGTIDSMEMEMTMDRVVYQSLQSSAEQEGYDSVEESMAADINEEAWDSISTDMTESEDEVTITITASGAHPDDLDDMDVTVEDDSLTFTIPDGFNQSDQSTGGQFGQYMDQIEMEYLVHMPGEITETNGEIQDDGESVRWSLADHNDVETFEATSERSEDGGDGGSDGIPGFSAGAALLALAALAGLVALRYRD